MRRNGFFGAKFGGCQKGECGSCSVLFDNQPINSCSILAAQADQHEIQTIEGIGQVAEQGWKKTPGLSAIQQAFVESGAIQCGYCTPAMVLVAKSLLDQNPDPTEEQVRDALSGILCRCTGYVKPVQAILKAAANLRGEYTQKNMPAPAEWLTVPPSDRDIETLTTSDVKTSVMPKIWTTPETQTLTTVGQPEPKVDAVKLVQGKPAFTADIEMRGMLYAKVLKSPLAHARIVSIDASKAKALPGVAAVLTWQDIPRVIYSTAGQSDPIPGPLDAFSLDNKVRFVGDRVAFVAAETPEIAEQALTLLM